MTLDEKYLYARYVFTSVYGLCLLSLPFRFALAYKLRQRGGLPRTHLKVHLYTAVAIPLSVVLSLDFWGVFHMYSLLARQLMINFLCILLCSLAVVMFRTLAHVLYQASNNSRVLPWPVAGFIMLLNFLLLVGTSAFVVLSGQLPAIWQLQAGINACYMAFFFLINLALLIAWRALVKVIRQAEHKDHVQKGQGTLHSLRRFQRLWILFQIGSLVAIPGNAYSIYSLFTRGPMSSDPESFHWYQAIMPTLLLFGWLSILWFTHSPWRPLLETEEMRSTMIELQKKTQAAAEGQLGTYIKRTSLRGTGPDATGRMLPWQQRREIREQEAIAPPLVDSPDACGRHPSATSLNRAAQTPRESEPSPPRLPYPPQRHRSELNTGSGWALWGAKAKKPQALVRFQSHPSLLFQPDPALRRDESPLPSAAAGEFESFSRSSYAYHGSSDEAGKVYRDPSMTDGPTRYRDNSMIVEGEENSNGQQHKLPQLQVRESGSNSVMERDVLEAETSHRLVVRSRHDPAAPHTVAMDLLAGGASRRSFRSECRSCGAVFWLHSEEFRFCMVCGKPLALSLESAREVLNKEQRKAGRAEAARPGSPGQGQPDLTEEHKVEMLLQEEEQEVEIVPATVPYLTSGTSSYLHSIVASSGLVASHSMPTAVTQDEQDEMARLRGYSFDSSQYIKRRQEEWQRPASTSRLMLSKFRKQRSLPEMKVSTNTNAPKHSSRSPNAQNNHPRRRQPPRSDNSSNSSNNSPSPRDEHGAGAPYFGSGSFKPEHKGLSRLKTGSRVSLKARPHTSSPISKPWTRNNQEDQSSNSPERSRSQRGQPHIPERSQSVQVPATSTRSVLLNARGSAEEASRTLSPFDTRKVHARAAPTPGIRAPGDTTMVERSEPIFVSSPLSPALSTSLSTLSPTPTSTQPTLISPASLPPLTSNDTTPPPVRRLALPEEEADSSLDGTKESEGEDETTPLAGTEMSKPRSDVAIYMHSGSGSSPYVV
eukprot:g39609.t1